MPRNTRGGAKIINNPHQLQKHNTIERPVQDVMFSHLLLYPPAPFPFCPFEHGKVKNTQMCTNITKGEELAQTVKNEES